jgi:hypothetical protein
VEQYRNRGVYTEAEDNDDPDDHLDEGEHPEEDEPPADSYVSESATAFLDRLPDPETLDPHWDEAAEAALVAEWETPHPLKQAVDGKSSSLRPWSNELRLWRNCWQFMQSYPTDIITANLYMVVENQRTFDTDWKRSAPDFNTTVTGARQCLWSPSFCAALDDLLTYPAWRGEHRLLCAAIQYAVICATDDFRPWRSNVPGTDIFLSMFIDEMAKRGDRDFAKAVHERALESYQAHIGTSLSRGGAGYLRPLKGSHSRSGEPTGPEGGVWSPRPTTGSPLSSAGATC